MDRVFHKDYDTYDCIEASLLKFKKSFIILKRNADVHL